MCEFAGFFQPGDARPESSIAVATRMVAAVTHRGPDDASA